MLKKILPILIVLLIASCGDDDNNNVQVLPPRLLADQAIEDDATIQEFLQTHFYNYEEFENPTGEFDYRIVIDTIAGENSDKTPLSQQVTSMSINVSSSEFTLAEEENDIPHTLYYLEAREGVGENPTFADSTFVRYEGTLLNGSVFDSNYVGTWFNLAQIQAPLQGFRGFSEGMVNFKAGENPTLNEDGTFTLDNAGIGMIIMPSGLAGFNSSSGIIGAYTPLIFKIELLVYDEADHDRDGIPSALEDLNMNGYLYDDNTDEKSEEDSGLQARFNNFVDSDDDDDGIPTRTEISDADGNIILPYPGSENGGTPDYLNPDVQRDPNNE